MLKFNIELGNKPKKTGLHPVFLRISEDRKHRRVYIGEDIHQKDWNSEKQEVRRSNFRHKQINDAIEKAINEAKQVKQENQDADLSQVKAQLKNGRNTDSFFWYAYEVTKNELYTTRRGKISQIEKLRRFKKGSDLTFNEITVPLLRDFEAYLKEIGNNKNTIHKTLSVVRTIIRKAIKEDVFPVEKNPFLKYELSLGKAERVRLTETELQAWIDAPAIEGSLMWKAKQYWLFAYYMAGMRFGDVACLKWKNLVEGRLEYTMQKTKQKQSIVPPQKAQEIIAYFEPNKPKPEEFVFPILNETKANLGEVELMKEISRKNALINKYLKMVCLVAEIPKDVSFHSARHTFADLGRRKTKDVYAMSKLLRHTKISTTQKYLEDLDRESTDDAMTAIFG